MQRFESLCRHRHLQILHCLLPSARQLRPERRHIILRDASSAQLYLSKFQSKTHKRHVAAASACGCRCCRFDGRCECMRLRVQLMQVCVRVRVQAQGRVQMRVPE